MTAKTPENIKCPHCGELLGLQLTTRLMSESRVSFVIEPHKGELLSARTVGDTITNMEKLLVSIGKDMGAKTAVLVEGLHWAEGTVKVDLLLTRHAPGVTKREKPEELPLISD